MATIEQWRDDVLERLRARRPHLVGRVRYGLRPPRRDRTAIVTDSSAALPLEALTHPFAAGIRQVPLPVMVGDQIHAEGSEDPRFELSLALASGQPVKTSRPAPGTFRRVYAELAQAGYARIVSVHLSGDLSGTVEAARLAAADAPVPVTVVASGTAGFALGTAVVDAAVDAGLGLPLERVLARAEAEPVGVEGMAHQRADGEAQQRIAAQQQDARDGAEQFSVPTFHGTSLPAGKP